MTLAPRNRRLAIGVEQRRMSVELEQLLQLQLRTREILPLHSIPQLFVGEGVHIEEEENAVQLTARRLAAGAGWSGGSGRHAEETTLVRTTHTTEQHNHE